jgi:catechol 2,3-dioxygenase-like lactoylglutathione lyase family enzyme
MRKTSELDHVAITVTDMEKSIAFYRDILQMELSIDFETDELSPFLAVPGVKVRSVIFKKGRSGKGMVELLAFRCPDGKPMHPERTPFDPGLWMLSFETDDVEAAYEDLLEKGVEFVNPPSRLNVPGMGIHNVVLIKGPDGVLVELVERPAKLRRV